MILSDSLHRGLIVSSQLLFVIATPAGTHQIPIGKIRYRLKRMIKAR